MQIKKSYNKLSAKRFWLDSTEFTATADELNKLDGVTASTAELNLVDNQPASITFTVGAEATNVINVAGQIEDAAGADMATATALRFYLADDSAGLNPSTTAPDGGIAIGTDGALIEHTNNLSGMLVSEADGDFDIDITDTGTPTFYLVVVMPNGSLEISGAITFA